MSTVNAHPESLNLIVPSGHITRLVGRLAGTGLRWAGRLEGVLATSLGDIKFAANRDTLPPQVPHGSWLSVRLMHRHSMNLPWLQHATLTAPLGQSSSWMPDTACHRPEHLERLRHLLGNLTPSMQALWVAALPDGASQHRFFRRIAAVDHHVYLGGLFDQSVAAAEHAFHALHACEYERGLTTLAALLFDLGKTADPRIACDLRRPGRGLTAHPLTRVRVLRACNAIEPQDPVLADDIRGLLTLAGGTPAAAHRLKIVHDAVIRSWLEGTTALRVPGMPQ